MGLDMYLRARRYFSGYSRISTDAEMNEWEHQIDFYDMHDFITDDSPHGYVEFCVAYWRKAHDVHEWFVRNVQGGVDECQPSPVNREQLAELRTECLRKLADMKTIEGDQEIEWAIFQFSETVKQIDKVLKLGSDWELIYQSSW